MAGDANVVRYVGNGVTLSTDASGLMPPDFVMDWRLGIRPFPWERPGYRPPLPLPRVIRTGPMYGTPDINTAEGNGLNINVFGVGEAPGWPDWSTDPQYDEGRPNTSKLRDGSVSNVCIRNSPVTSDELARIVQPGGTVTVAGGDGPHGIVDIRATILSDPRFESVTPIRRFPHPRTGQGTPVVHVLYFQFRRADSD